SPRPRRTPRGPPRARGYWRSRPGTARGRRRRGCASAHPQHDDRDHPDAAPVRRIPSHSFVLLCSRSAPRGDREPDHGTAVRSRSYVEVSADQLCSLMHDLHAEIATAAIGDRLHIEAATIVTDLQGPSLATHVGADHDGRGTSVLADILSRL